MNSAPNQPADALKPHAPPDLPARPRAIHPGVRITVRGRSILLRGLRQPATGILLWLAMLGPGWSGAAVRSPVQRLGILLRGGGDHSRERVREAALDSAARPPAGPTAPWAPTATAVTRTGIFGRCGRGGRGEHGDDVPPFVAERRELVDHQRCPRPHYQAPTLAT